MVVDPVIIGMVDTTMLLIGYDCHTTNAVVQYKEPIIYHLLMAWDTTKAYIDYRGLDHLNHPGHQNFFQIEHSEVDLKKHGPCAK